MLRALKTVKKHLRLICFVAFFAVTGQQALCMQESLWQVLDSYGFNEKQKKSLEFLMRESGIIGEKESFDDLFPKRHNNDLLFKDVIDFVKLTQRHFTVRKAGEERWHLKPKDWMERNRDNIVDAIDDLGLIGTLNVSEGFKPDLVVVFGATYPGMKIRFDYLDDHFKGDLNSRYVAFFEADRKASIGPDGSAEELNAIAKEFNITIDALTEAELAKKAFNESKTGKILPPKRLMVICDKRKEGTSRSTTASCVETLCQELKGRPDIKRVVFIFNQPHVKYQEYVVKGIVLQEGLEGKVQLEVVGPGASRSMPIEKLVSAVGSEIFAKTPHVLRSEKITTQDQSLLEEFKKIYGKYPFAFSKIKLNLHLVAKAN